MTEEKELLFVEGSIQKHKEFVSPEELYQELISNVQKYHPSDDISMIEKAYKIASDAHKDQKRKSGEPYIIHPLNVASILSDLEMDKETIVAGILHDVVEDTIMTYEDMALPNWKSCPCPLIPWMCPKRNWKCRQKTYVKCFWLWQRISVS